MKRNWETEELIEHFSISQDEANWLSGRSAGNQIGAAVLLKCFQYLGRFPTSPKEVPDLIISYISRQLIIAEESYANYDWQSRRATYDRSEIRDMLGFRETGKADHDHLSEWLSEHKIMQDNHNSTVLRETLYQYLLEQKLEPPTSAQLKRIIDSALYRFETRFFEETLEALPASSRLALDEWLYTGEETENFHQSLFATLKYDPGTIGVKSLFAEAQKLKDLQAIELPETLFQHIGTAVLDRYRRRAETEAPRELRRHPIERRYTLLACFCWQRQQEVSDNLVNLLIQLIHRMESRAEYKVEREFIRESKKIMNKNRLLYRIASAALENPEGSVREVIFPVVSEAILQELVDEFKASGIGYHQRVHHKQRGSYSHHYRQMLPEILEVLDFQSNNQQHRPLIEAIELLKRYSKSQQHYYPVEEEVPIEGVIPPGKQPFIIETDPDGYTRINRINYEMCVLDSLRDSLRCKEVWVPGADHYRNPDEDLPQDFDERREMYCKRLNQPLSADEFIARLKKLLHEALSAFNENLPQNPHVSLLKRNRGWIKLSPLKAQAEPTQLVHLKAEVDRRWHMISLLDMLKEADLRCNFTDLFQTAASREVLSPAVRQKRLLLCLYALGTNIGLKQASMGDHGENIDNLRHIYERYMNSASLRAANARLVNATLEARLSHIWGEGTMSCAADSRQVSSRGENLKTEWHSRYRGRGVMIYWHVERGSTAIYSQLKAPSSSEVASMIEGLIRHSSEMSLSKTYTDSHGQSEIGFAFCHLLGFQLMPRIKDIYRQKLYLPEKGSRHLYPELDLILTRPIKWHLIRQQYDEFIKYASALQFETAEPEALLKRFTRNNVQHPTYAALLELGKVIKTLFLCEYLSSEEIRREIHEGLNIIESWNSANGFVFYGKTGEFSSSQLKTQQLSVLALQLLQNSLVYINTLMLQKVLSEPDWYDRMEAEDWRGLTPLFYEHVNPYGLISIDMAERVPNLAA
jgi:TnpA family transposase